MSALRSMRKAPDEHNLPIIVFERKLYVMITDNHLSIIIGLFRVETLKSW